jgi:hypothetical protein
MHRRHEPRRATARSFGVEGEEEVPKSSNFGAALCSLRVAGESGDA